MANQIIQAYFICDEALRDAAIAINPISVGKVDPQLIDGQFANNLALGLGIEPIFGKWVIVARVLTDEQYVPFWSLFENVPAYMLDTSIIFAPQPEV